MVVAKLSNLIPLCTFLKFYTHLEPEMRPEHFKAFLTSVQKMHGVLHLNIAIFWGTYHAHELTVDKWPTVIYLARDISSQIY